MENERDDLPPNPDDMRWEERRTATLRAFEVVLRDGTREKVFAHYWDNNNAAGHWYFYTVQPSGRTLIHRAWGSTLVKTVTEVTAPEVLKRIDNMVRQEMALAQGKRGLAQIEARQRRSDFRVH